MPSPPAHNANGSLLTVSPPDSNFTPRREFVREHHVQSDFALLAIASTGLVRLSAFPQDVKDALQHMLQRRQGIRGIREEKSLQLVEFSLDQKPWASSKSAESERLFLDILAIVYQHGYSFVSTIDYGRETDDRMSVAFSRSKEYVRPSDSRPTSLVPQHTQVKVPFGLSFVSSTVLRVINSPINSTPSILSAVRTAWPRGVISERTLSNRCFEFKLKGYKWFQEDTFASDSLTHTLSLLRALDKAAFTLIASVSLSGSRSRVRDLWIFTGPPQELSESLHDSVADLSRTLPSKVSSEFGRFEGHHARSSSLPVNAPSAYPHSMHARAATDPNALQSMTQPRSPSPRNSHSVLRKKSSIKLLGSGPPPSYEGHSPVKQSFDEDTRHAQPKFRVSEDGNVDMTGVGSAAQRGQHRSNTTGGREVTTIDTRDTYAAQDFGHPGYQPRENHAEQAHLDEYPDYPNNERIKTGEIFYLASPNRRSDERKRSSEKSVERIPDFFRDDDSPEMSRSPSNSDSSRQLTPRDDTSPPSDVPQSVYGQIFTEAVRDSNARILSPGAFRDSAFSSSTDRSCEIPIKWTGPDGDPKQERLSTQEDSFAERPLSEADRPSDEFVRRKGRTGPRRQSPLNFPGAWQPTPIEEQSEEQAGFPPSAEELVQGSKERTMPERKQVDAERVVSPTKSDQLAASRKSETALYAMMPDQSSTSRYSPPPVPRVSPNPAQPIGSGWVMVNVESSRQKGDRPTSSSSGNTSNLASNQSRSSLSPPVASSMSPIAKALVAADAVTHQEEEEQKPSGLKRLFGGSKKSRKTVSDGHVSKTNTTGSEDRENSRKTSLQRSRR